MYTKKIGGGPWSKIMPNPITNTSYTDNDVVPGTKWFYYRVRAVSGDETKTSPGYSNVVGVQGNFGSQKPTAPRRAPRLPTPLSVMNSPNPFNPLTSIVFELPEASSILLALYDMRGRQITRLAEGWHPAGTHTVRWDSSDHPSGVYFYRLRVGGLVKQGKMLVLR